MVVGCTTANVQCTIWLPRQPRRAKQQHIVSECGPLHGVCLVLETSTMMGRTNGMNPRLVRASSSDTSSINRSGKQVTQNCSWIASMCPQKLYHRRAGQPAKLHNLRAQCTPAACHHTSIHTINIASSNTGLLGAASSPGSLPRSPPRPSNACVDMHHNPHTKTTHAGASAGAVKTVLSTQGALHRQRCACMLRYILLHSSKPGTIRKS